MKSYPIVAASLLACGTCLQAQPEDNPRFQPEERMAIGQVCMLSISQALMCKGPKKRWCSMEELMKELRPDRPGIKDPSDSNYRLVISVKGADIAQAAAIAIAATISADARLLDAIIKP